MRAILIKRHGHSLPKYLTEYKHENYKYVRDKIPSTFYNYGERHRIGIVDVTHQKQKTLKKRYGNPY